MEDWIHLFVIIIFHLIVYELQSEFFGDVLNSLLCCTWCLLVLWVILTVCESSLEDWDIQLREQWRGPQFFVATWGDERIHMSAFFRKWLSWWGGKLLRLAVIFFFFNFILCKSLHRANSPFWVSMQSSTGSVWDWECEVHSYSSQEGSTAYRENWELLGKMCHNEFTMDSHLCK